MDPKWQEQCEHWLIQVQDHLRDQLIPFWTGSASNLEQSGFSPYFDENAVPERASFMTAVAQAQRTFFYSALYRAGLGGPDTADAARRHADALSDQFWDHAHAGWYWIVSEGEGDADKHLFAQAMAMLALSEFAMATGDFNGAEQAVATFETCQNFAADNRRGGYGERFTQTWAPAPDAPGKSFRSHVCLMLASANMYEATGAEVYGRRALDLLDLILERFVSEDGLGVAWRSADWGAVSGTPSLNFGVDRMPDTMNVAGESAVSYGDNFEFVWAAIHVIGVTGANPASYTERLRKGVVALLEVAVDRDSGGIYAGEDGAGGVDRRKEFAGQACALAALPAAFLAFEDPDLLESYGRIHDFVFAQCVDGETGEWAPLPASGATSYRLADAWKTGFHPLRALLSVERSLVRIAF